MRNHRKHTVLAVAAVAALSLGLTACGGDGSGTKDEGGASTSQTVTDAAKSAATAGATVASDSAGSSAGSAASASGGSGTAKSGTNAQPAAKNKAGSGSASGRPGATAPVCTFQDVKVKAAKADETPTEHVVLTATNTSGHSCRLLKYPLLAFGPVQTAKDIPAVAKSNPGVPVVLASGASAYANVRIANGGAHEDNKVVKEFNVNLFAADGPAEGSIVVHAPAGGLAVDEAVAKTGYWTEELRNGADEF
ncbi:DUF4232 domain-containing protein [Streptomyces sp. NPDC006743]|uniref:DUF4232 domain-containing protein n=1 Tax=Streptomyces sp. NPDC006743 TaxID=3154480 RepID=UPI003455FA5C